MQEAFSRRDFLKYGVAATGTLAAMGTGTWPSGADAAPLHVREVDRLTVLTLTDNCYDGLRPDTKVAKRFRAGPGKPMHAEWGLSFLVETVVAGETSTCMYDFGVDPAGLLGNIAVLGVDLSKVKSFSLSHGHWDHYLAAAGILKQARVAPGTPLFLGEEAFARRYSLRPGAPEPTDLGQLSRETIEAAGLKIFEVTAPTEVVPGAYLAGRIDRITPYEKVPQGFQVRRGDKLEHDTFPGEQALFCNVRGKGLVILTGCGHAGMVNTVRQAMKAAGTERLHGVIGGFHLANAKPDVIQATVGDLKAMRPDVVVPAHCTGFEAIVSIARDMPDAFLLSSAGAQYTFTGSVSA